MSYAWHVDICFTKYPKDKDGKTAWSLNFDVQMSNRRVF